MTTNTVGDSASNNVDWEPSAAERCGASLLTFSERMSMDIVGLLLLYLARWPLHFLLDC